MSNVAKGGYREDLKQYFRSRWEANLARYYNFIKVPWAYEPQEFEFKAIKRGSRFYKPDFYLPNADEYIELKGYFTEGGKTKLRRFKKYYPEEFKKLRFVIEDPLARSEENGKVMEFLLDDLDIEFVNIISYRGIEGKLGALIPNWE